MLIIVALMKVLKAQTMLSVVSVCHAPDNFCNPVCTALLRNYEDTRIRILYCQYVFTQRNFVW